jgi:hypothetical protein
VTPILASLWWLGDWWALGESRYGERKAIVEAEDWEGPAYQTCRNAASIATAFEMSRRQPMLDLRDASRWLLANGEPVTPTAKAALGEIGRMPRRPRPILVFPAKYARLLQAFVCLRAR